VKWTGRVINFEKDLEGYEADHDVDFIPRSKANRNPAERQNFMKDGNFEAIILGGIGNETGEDLRKRLIE
jgi:hypothetical protein